MTLSTLVGFQGQVDPEELHAWVNTHLLNEPDAIIDRLWSQENTIANRGWQGFNAWVITHHNNGELFIWDVYDDEDGATGPDVHAYVDFDTAYGYRGPDGEDCNTLHATYIVRLFNEFATPRGLKLFWQNEYTGEWFEGITRLTTLFKSGDQAQEWFKQIVLPMIEGDLK